MPENIATSASGKTNIILIVRKKIEGSFLNKTVLRIHV